MELQPVRPEYPAIKISGEEFAELTNTNLRNLAITPDLLPTVRVPTGGSCKWTIEQPDGSLAVMDHIDGIVIHWHATRVYWGDQPISSSSIPLCTSADGLTGTGDQYGTGTVKTIECSTCPNNRWTRIGGKLSRIPCKEKAQVYVLTEIQLLPVRLIIPTMSLQRWRHYLVSTLVSQLRAKYWQVITRFGLVQIQSREGMAYAQVVPTALARVSPEVLEAASERVRFFAEVLRSAQPVFVPEDEDNV